MGRFGEREIVKEKSYAGKKPIKIWDAKLSRNQLKQKIILSI